MNQGVFPIKYTNKIYLISMFIFAVFMENLVINLLRNINELLYKLYCPP